MDQLAQTRAIIVSTIVRDTPRAFWENVRAGARRTYADVFEQVRNEAGTLAEQKLDKLYQDRHFAMEHLLATVAKGHGFACSATLLTENNRRYVYATKGSIGLTQVYVPCIGAMPRPARFRERHAALGQT